MFEDIFPLSLVDLGPGALVVGLRERHTPDNGAEMWVTLRVLDGYGATTTTAGASVRAPSGGAVARPHRPAPTSAEG